MKLFMSLSLTVLAGIVLAAVAYVKSANTQARLTVAFNQNGLSSLKYDGVEFLKYGDFRLDQVTLADRSGKAVPGDTNAIVQVDQQRHEVTRRYPWGVVAIGYAVTANRLALSITTRNSSNSTIQGVWYEPLGLQFPSKVQEYDGSIPLLVHNIGAPAVLKISYRSGVLVVANDDVTKPLLLGFPWALDRPANTVFPLTLNTDRVRSFPDSLPRIDRPIPPGGTDQYQISLRFGPSKSTAADLARDIYQKFASAFPSRLNWPDRRPLGTIFLSRPQANWPNNPRGWLSDPKIDIATKDGIAYFRTRLLALADSSINIMKEMNAQGAITFDIEGQQLAHLVSYIGDPRLTNKLAPEMTGVADEYFKRFRDAGFRVGVCIRPQQLKLSPDGKSATQVLIADPTQLLIDKIRYAKQRWGITLAFINYNTNIPDPNPLDARIFQKVATAFPDVLLIPEHSNLQYYACTAPYKELRQGFSSTPASVRAMYPNAFTFINTVDGPIDQQHQNLVAAVKQGDSVIYRTWYPDPQNNKVKSLYQAR